MRQNAVKIEVAEQETSRNSLQSIANDPVKLRYWKEIARLWKESLDVDVRLIKNKKIEEISYRDH